MRKRVQIALAVLLVGVFVFFLWHAWLSPGRILSPDLVRLSDGRSLRLERYEFQAKSVRYDWPNRPVARLLMKVLPGFVTLRLKWLQPKMTAFCYPSFPGEPVLSVAVSADGSFAGRWAVSDGHGQVFDPMVNNTMFQAMEIRAFPRRSENLRLMFMENDKSVAEFMIPNPCPGPHPKWTAKPTPVVVADDDVEFKLEKFIAEGGHSRTVCGFGIHENGQDSLAWRVASLEVSDATGNHWRPMWASGPELVNGSEVMVGFFGALWPEEDAWKLRVGFKRVAEFPGNELLWVDHIPIPDPQEILHPPSTYETNGARIEVAAIIGSAVNYTNIRFLNADRIRDCFTVVVKGRILSQGRHLVFVGAKDEHGNVLNLQGIPAEPGQIAGSSPDLLPYSFNFKSPQDGHEMALLLAVTQSRVVEFLAKPEQTTTPIKSN